MSKKIYIIHENEEWITQLKDELEKLNMPYETWFVDELELDLNSTPPYGVFYNRMSASSHTRGHRYAPEMTGAMLSWLKSHDRVVINDRDALRLELSKVEQYTALMSAGITTPETIAVNSIDLLYKAAEKLNQSPFIIKPNRGGKGAGVQLFYTLDSLKSTIMDGGLGDSLDGIWLVQTYIKPSDGCITRVEFVGGEMIYAVRVDASGGFELCPADSCHVNDDFCPTDGVGSKFSIHQKYENDDIYKYKNFLLSNGIGIGAIEYAKGSAGIRYVYDVNTNTNYNNQAELDSGGEIQGMREIAKFLSSQLKSL
ncbi:MAG: alpha-L-glutamate ligase [Bacteroidetes bacterium]|nr:MAG: alpha-L-glutamate ligase [Bacteroidota bacterium]